MQVVSQASGLISLGKLEEMAKKQLKLERKGTVTVKSIEKKDNLENLAHYVRTLKISFSYLISYDSRVDPLLQQTPTL
jgi:hypothetical protein